MARSLRVHYPGAVYHVTVRGNNREVIFPDDNDKQYYLNLMVKYKEKFCFLIYAYVFMNNHIHLLIEVRESSLSDIMKGLQQCFTQYINRKYKRVGHVFQQRYHAKLCTKDTYLLSIVKYIHNNPRKAGLVKDLNYPWSSHKHYMARNSSLVNCEWILSFFSEKDEQVVHQYQAFMEELDQVVYQPTEQYVSMPDPEKKLSPLSKPKNVTMEELIGTVVRYYGLDKEELIDGRRSKNVVTVRKLIAYLALKLHICSGNEIAIALGVNPSQISRSYYGVAQNSEFLEKTTLLIAELKTQ